MRWSRAGDARPAAESQSPSATEQRLRSDAALDGLGIVFVNIDWKKSRHTTDGAERRNLEILKATVTSIVTEMNPALICLCEFGEVGHPLPDDVIPRLQDAIESAWQEAALATEQGLASEGLAFAHPSGEPYLSVWRPERIECRHHALLTDLYQASGEPRTAQMFLVGLASYRLLALASYRLLALASYPWLPMPLSSAPGRRCRTAFGSSTALWGGRSTLFMHFC